MKRISLAGSLLVIAIALAVAQAQTPSPSPYSETRPRTTPTTSPTPPQSQLLPPRTYPPPSQSTEQTQRPGVVLGNHPEARPEEAGSAATERPPDSSSIAVSLLSPPVIQEPLV